MPKKCDWDNFVHYSYSCVYLELKREHKTKGPNTFYLTPCSGHHLSGPEIRGGPAWSLSNISLTSHLILLPLILNIFPVWLVQ